MQKRFLVLLTMAAMLLSLLLAVPVVGSGTVEVDLRVEGITETIYEGSAAVEPGATALDVLEQSLTVAGVVYEITDDPTFGKYIKSIKGEAAGAFGGYDGWLYLVNGSMAALGVAEYEIQDGDELVFYYGMYPPDTLIPEVEISPAEPESGEEITVTVSSSYYNWETEKTVNVLVENATVACNGQEYTTDEQGVATIAGLDAGSYTLRVSKDVLGSYPALVRSGAIPLTVSLPADKTVQVRVEGSRQNLFDDEVTVASSGEQQTALDALEQALTGAVIDYEITDDPTFGKYIKSIKGEAAGDFGGYDGWLYLVNGSMAASGADQYEIQDGDELVFYYGKYPPDTLIPEVRISPAEPESGEEITVTVSSSYYNWETEKTVNVLAENATVACNGREYTTDAQGEATIPGLARGSYTLRVSKDVPGSYPALVRSGAIPLTVVAAGNDDLQEGIDKAIDYLIAQQEEDGKLGPNAALALYKAGRDVSQITTNGKNDLDYLQRLLQDDYAGYINSTSRLALTIMEIVAGGGDPADFAGHNLVAELTALQDDNGLFGTNEEQDYIVTQYWAIMALHEAGVDIPQAQQARQWLLENVSSNGGWSWAVGEGPSPDMTAYVIRALLVLGEAPDSDAITNAKTYLKTYQHEDAGFDNGWTSDSNVWTTAEVIKALVDLDIDPSGDTWSMDGYNPVLYLLNQQKASGEIGNLAGTADSLTALVMFAAKYDLDENGSDPSHTGGGGEGSADTISVKIAVVGPGNEFLFKPGEVTISKKGRFGLTAMEALEATGLSWSFSTEWEGFVVAIEGVRNAGLNGWCYSVNGQSATVLAMDQAVSSGSRVIWWYSTDAMSNGPTWQELLDLSAAAGGAAAVVKPADEDEVKNNLAQYGEQLDTAFARVQNADGSPLLVLNADKRMTPLDAVALKKELDNNRVHLQQPAGAEETLMVDNEIALLVPENALLEETNLTVKELGTQEAPQQYAVRLASSVYEFGPDGLVFAQPVTISITVALTDDINLEDLTPAWYDEKSGQWIPLPAVIDLETGQVVFRIDHFTSFAIIQKPPRPSFNDLEGYAWAQEAIEILAGQNVIAGTGQGFEPGRNITRAEFVKLVVTAAGLEAKKGQISQFSDVKAGDWFEPAICSACSHQLTAGYADGSFKPGQSISRYEVAVILHNADKNKVLNGSTGLSYADSNNIPDWAAGGVKYVQAAKLMQGYEDGSFGGSRPLTRAEAAVIIYRYLNARLIS
ncbi:MAG: DUF4430 domain-containing protein [Syntrophomonadaceae bacterium]